MTRTSVLASIFGLGLLGCGGGGDSPADAGGDAPSTPDAAPGATAITFTVTTLDGLPEVTDVVLISDNAGPWQPVTATGGAYHASVVGPRYAIARACRDDATQYQEGYLYYLTVDDPTDVHDVSCHYVATAAIGGAITGIAPTQAAKIVSSYSAATLQAGATDYAMTMPPGTTDLVARVYPAVPSTQPRPTQRLLIERDVAVTDGLVHDLDFDADGFDPETHTIAISNPGASEHVAVSLYQGGLYSYGIESTVVTGDDYHAPPANRMRVGELLTVSRSSSTANGYRNVQLTVGAPADLTAAYGPAYSAPTPTVVASSPTVRLAGTLPHVDGADVYGASGSVFDDTTLDFAYWSESFTARWAGDQPIDYTFPDLAGIGGWNVGLIPGSVDWDASVGGSALRTLPIGYPNPPVLGDTLTFAATTGTLTLP